MTAIYDAVLMLSGGKDSCSLAFVLKEQGVNFLALTVDQGFLSDVARKNIAITIEILDLDHFYIHPKASMYRNAIKPLIPSGMETACTMCSSMSIALCHAITAGMGVKKIYAGFTKYTAAAAGWTPAKEKMLDGGVMLINPYYEAYDLSKIRALMKEHGLEIDPIKTNCTILPELLRQTNRQGLPNHLRQEIELLHAANKIDKKEFNKYWKFVCQS